MDRDSASEQGLSRRGFMQAAAMAPVVAPMVASASVPHASGILGAATLEPMLVGEAVVGKFVRLSIEEGDPGFVPLGKLKGDRRSPTIYLDGVKQDFVQTVDAREGWVKRIVTTERGNIAHNGECVLTEIVRGRVEIRIDDEAIPREHAQPARSERAQSTAALRSPSDADHLSNWPFAALVQIGVI